MKKLLFVSWDGPQVSYMEGLFIPILSGLRDQYDIHIVHFTWGDAAIKLEEITRKEEMRYSSVRVRRKPGVAAGALWTMFEGRRYLSNYIRQQGIDLVIFRSTFPALMAAGLRKRRLRWIFDTDGLGIEERVEFGGLKKDGLQYKLFKFAERRLLHRADTVLLRAAAAIPLLGVAVPKCHVVSNGRDIRVFHPMTPAERQACRDALGLRSDEWLLVYCGSLGPQYCVPEMIEVLRQMPEARLLFLTNSPEYLDTIETDPALRSRCLVRNLPFSEVPRYLGAADAGLAIREPSPSMKGVSPVKIGEYLLCGLPLVASPGIGDTEALLSGNNACYILEDHTASSLQKAADWLRTVRDSGLREEAHQLGMARFGLDESIQSYKLAILSA